LIGFSKFSMSGEGADDDAARVNVTVPGSRGRREIGLGHRRVASLGEDAAFPLARRAIPRVAVHWDRRSAAETAVDLFLVPAVAFSQLGEPAQRDDVLAIGTRLFEHAQRGGVVLLVDEATAYTM